MSSFKACARPDGKPSVCQPRSTRLSEAEDAGAKDVAGVSIVRNSCETACRQLRSRCGSVRVSRAPYVLQLNE